MHALIGFHVPCAIRPNSLMDFVVVDADSTISQVYIFCLGIQHKCGMIDLFGAGKYLVTLTILNK